MSINLIEKFSSFLFSLNYSLLFHALARPVVTHTPSHPQTSGFMENYHLSASCSSPNPSPVPFAQLYDYRIAVREK